MANVTRGLTARIIREGSGEDCAFISEHGFSCYLNLGGQPVAVVQVVLQKIAKEVSAYDYETARDFEEGVRQDMQKFGAPEGVSFACMLHKHGALFLTTAGQGEIYIQRAGVTTRLLHGDKYAKGALQDDDIFILTTTASTGQLETHGGWARYLEGVDISGRDISGLILTTSIIEAEEEKKPEKARAPAPHKENRLHILMQKAKAMDRRRLLTLAAIGFIGILLIVSLVVGLMRRANDSRLKQIAFTKTEITQKLQQAEDVAFLNSGRAAGLINDAKRDLAELKEQIGDRDSKELTELESLIAQTESAIFKKEEKQPEEFFDLAIENKNARGTLIARSGSRAAIADPAGSVYILDLEKKSLDRFAAGVKNPRSLAVGENAIFILGTDSIVQIDEEGAAKKIVEKDKEWGNPTAIATFNSNLYVLDGGKGVIHKYTPTEKGYGSRSSYLQGGGPSILGAQSIAIDASVYVARESSVLKYTAGLQDGFAPQFPEGGARTTKVETAEDIEKVYVWDKPRGLIYVVSKNGSYERQIKSAALKSADDLITTSEYAYLLKGQKIYKISLD